jgi:hypothetical protein
VSVEASAKANPMDALFQSVWFWLIYLLLALFEAGAITLLWFAVGPGNPLIALTVVGATWSLTPALCAPAVIGRLPRRWFHVPMRERVLHRIAGVGIFRRLLDRSGWNHLIKPLRRFSGQRGGLLSLEWSARTSAGAHGICFAIHVFLAVLALLSVHPWRGALWMLLPGVVVHLYPVLLQRSIMLRVQPLLDRSTASRAYLDTLSRLS